MQLLNLVQAYPSDQFAKFFKQTIESLPKGTLPLSKGAAITGYVDENSYTVSVLSVSDDESSIYVKMGVFFTEVLGGCSCSGDPGSDVTYDSFCQMLVTINKQEGTTRFKVIDEH